MNEHDVLIERLCRDAHPVKRPAGPWRRAAGWMLAALPAGYAASLVMPRGHPDWSAPGAAWALLWLLLSFGLGLLAIQAAFAVSIVGQRPPRRHWLAALGVAWLAAGLLSVTGSADAVGHLGDGIYCYTFMLVAGLPMSVLAVAALRRTRSARPRASLALAALGIAATAQVLLGLCHPINGELVDVLMHGAAGVTLLAATVVGGGRWVRL